MGITNERIFAIGKNPVRLQLYFSMCGFACGLWLDSWLINVSSSESNKGFIPEYNCYVTKYSMLEKKSINTVLSFACPLFVGSQA